MGIKVNGNEPARLARTVVASMVGIAAAFIALPSDILAQAWPAKPVRFILGFPPGGGSDILGRIVAAKMQEQMGQTVVIENRPGASGNIAAEQVAKSAPDGYTIYLAQIAAVAISPSLFPKLGYDPLRDFAPISLIATGPNVLVVHPALPVKNVKDLIALAKRNPGKLNYSSSGIGGFPHLNTELFKMMAGVDMAHVPFKGAGPAVADTAAGNTQVQIGSLPSVLGQVRAGRLRALAVGGPRRNPLLPDVPTINESGLPGYETYIWFGLFAPRTTPANLVAQMHAAVNTSLESPDMLKRMDEQGIDPARRSIAEFAKLMESETVKWTKVIKAANITGE